MGAPEVRACIVFCLHRLSLRSSQTPRSLLCKIADPTVRETVSSLWLNTASTVALCPKTAANNSSSTHLKTRQVTLTQSDKYDNALAEHCFRRRLVAEKLAITHVTLNKDTMVTLRSDRKLAAVPAESTPSRGRKAAAARTPKPDRSVTPDRASQDSTRRRSRRVRDRQSMLGIIPEDVADTAGIARACCISQTSTGESVAGLTIMPVCKQLLQKT